MSIEAMKQMVEALMPYRSTITREYTAVDAAIDAGRKAIAEAEKQEPVAYDKTEMNFFVQELYDKKMQEGKHGHYETMFHVVHQAINKLSPPQRQWVGLKEKEVEDYWDWEDFQCGAGRGTILEMVRDIEAKLKEKNT